MQSAHPTTKLLPDTYSDKEKASLLAKLKDVRTRVAQDGRSLSNYDLLKLLELVEEAERREDVSGFHKYFKGPYAIENLPKHEAFFEATKNYRETLLLGGNRTGKTRSGAMVVSVTATGQYPDWWPGVRFNHHVSNWAAGKTGQTTRDTVQDALLGPPGHWGTGAIPKDCIVDTTARQGIANAVDTIMVRHESGQVSTIGLKSYDQKAASFYGTAKHVVWLDEPCPDVVYNECLIRTMTTNGIIVHTITPKEGLTRLLAEILSSADLLAGAERIKGLEAMIKMQELEDLNNAQ